MSKTDRDDDKRFETANAYYQYIRSKQKRRERITLEQIKQAQKDTSDDD